MTGSTDDGNPDDSEPQLPHEGEPEDSPFLGEMGALPRSLDFLSPRSLAERLSCRREDLPLIVPLKDLTDNGLDESDLKDIVNVDVSDPAEGVTLSVTNTICGRSTGLTPEKTAKAINPDNRTSAKRWFMRVRRGANGGGLAYGIGISYAYSEEDRKSVV